jgi:hypothetical protein
MGWPEAIAAVAMSVSTIVLVIARARIRRNPNAEYRLVAISKRVDRTESRLDQVEAEGLETAEKARKLHRRVEALSTRLKIEEA